MKIHTVGLAFPLILLASATVADEPIFPHHENDSKDKAALIDLSKMLLAGDVDSLKNKAIDGVVSEGVGVSKSYLEQYFPTVEISYSGVEGSKPTGGILVVAPLSDEKDIFNTYFTQISTFYSDNRTTLNLGLGYRKLSDNKMLLTGINAFYDHEFPYDHGRTSLGVEAKTSMWEVSANKYWSSTKTKIGKNGKNERALDGYDIEGGVPLPYMNWATVFVRHSKWDSEIAGSKDLKVNEVNLRAMMPTMPGLEIEAGRMFNSGAVTKDENFLHISYNLTAALAEKPRRRGWTSNKAYELSSMEVRRFEKIRRNNSIVKQISAAGVVTVRGF